jgi:hypothetical protein
MARRAQPSSGARPDVARPRRGRPPKFNRPTRVVALTLPDDVVQSLRRIDADLARAVVTLVEKHAGRAPAASSERPEAELVSVAGRRSLIVVKRAVFRSLPGIQFIPLDADRAFLALNPARGLSDLELAVLDRLEEDGLDPHERQALRSFRARLRQWRRDPSTRFEVRSIIVVESLGRSRPGARPPRPSRQG